MKLPALALLVGLGVVLSACAPDIVIPKPDPPPPPPPPTQVKFRVEGADDLNLDASRRASPLLVRVYQLRSDASLKGADFFGVFKDDKTALAADLVHKEEFFLKPGETKELTFEPKPDTQLMAAFAAFRDVATASWRAAAPVVAHKINPYVLKLSKNQLDLQALPPETPPPPPAPPAEPKADDKDKEKADDAKK